MSFRRVKRHIVVDLFNDLIGNNDDSSASQYESRVTIEPRYSTSVAKLVHRLHGNHNVIGRTQFLPPPVFQKTLLMKRNLPFELSKAVASKFEHMRRKIQKVIRFNIASS